MPVTFYFSLQSYISLNYPTRNFESMENIPNFALYYRTSVPLEGIFIQFYRMAETIDKTDIGILHALQENGRLTIKELAAQVNLSSTPVFERLRRLEANGYIKKYMAVLDADKLNRGFMVFCNVKMKHLNREIAQNFMDIVQNIPEVTECYNISGSFDYLLKIHVPDMKHYQQFCLNVLGTIENLSSLESTFVMDEVKHVYGINV